MTPLRGLSSRHLESIHPRASFDEWMSKEKRASSTRAWGMTPSFAFVGEPQTNGVVERFFRTLKPNLDSAKC